MSESGGVKHEGATSDRGEDAGSKNTFDAAGVVEDAGKGGNDDGSTDG